MQQKCFSSSASLIISWPVRRSLDALWLVMDLLILLLKDLRTSSYSCAAFFLWAHILLRLNQFKALIRHKCNRLFISAAPQRARVWRADCFGVVLQRKESIWIFLSGSWLWETFVLDQLFKIWQQCQTHRELNPGPADHGSQCQGWEKKLFWFLSQWIWKNRVDVDDFCL